MSLILEALNKADRERDNQPKVPDLQTVHGRIVPPSAPKRHWGVYVIIALLVLILFLLIAVLVRQTMAPRPDVNPVAPPAPPVAQAPVAPPAVPAQAPAQTQAAMPAPAPMESDVHDIYQDANAAPPQEYPTGYDDTPAPPKGKKSRSRLLDELEAQAQALDETNNAEDDLLPASVRKTPPKAPKTADNILQDANDLNEEKIRELWAQTKKEIPDKPSNSNARLETQIQEAIKDTLSLYKQIPYLHELPERTQNAVPSINYVNHIYSEKAGGAVIINKKTLRAGQEISPGMLVERVASDGVIIQYQGLHFKLNALSSWVNFSANSQTSSGGKKN